MFGITFLSTKDREQLTILQNSLMGVDPSLRDKISRKIRELKDKEKLLSDCTVEECQDLQMQLDQKIQLALLAGKPKMARSFNMLQTAVGEQYMIAQMQEMKVEAIKAQTAQEASNRNRLSKILGTKVNDPNKSSNSTGTSGSSKPKNPWSVDFGADD